MRAILPLSLAFLLPLAAHGQSKLRPKGFLHLNWGASRLEVLALLKQQGATLPEDDNGLSPLVVKGGTFSSQDVASWTFDFDNGKLYSASVSMKSAESPTALYRELKQQLISKYGPHGGERKLAASREDRRARAATAASGQPVPKRGTGVLWRFEPNLQEKETLSIACEVAPAPGMESSKDESTFLVTLRYTNETMKAQAEKTATPTGPAGSTGEGSTAPKATPKPAKSIRPSDL